MPAANKVKDISAFVGAQYLPPGTKIYGMYHKRKKEDPSSAKPETWFFKRYCEEVLTKLSEEDRARAGVFPSIEAGISDMYGWMLGRELAPKVRPAKEHGESLWLASKNLEGSRPLEAGTQIYKTGPDRPYSAKALCTAKNARSLAAALVSSYVFEEYDLSFSAMRVTASGEFARIDMGLSPWSITCQYKYDETDGRWQSTSPDQTRYYYDHVKPNEAMPINQDILKGLPNLKFGQHGYKPKNTVYVEFENDEAKKEFERQKWKYCLKALLLNEAILKSSLDQFLDDRCPAKQEVLDHIKARLRALKTCLLSMPEFNGHLIANMAQFKAELFKEFEAYNALKKPKDPNRFKSMAALIGPIWEDLIKAGRRQLILDSQAARNSLIQPLKTLLETEIGLLDPSPYLRPVRHEKITRLRNQQAQLNATLGVSAAQQIRVVCEVIAALNSIMLMRMGCIESLTRRSEKSWAAFKGTHADWIQAFSDASDFPVATTVFAHSRANTEGTPLLQKYAPT